MKSHSTILAITFGFLFINSFYNSQTATIILTVFVGISIASNIASDLFEKIWFLISKILSYIIPNIILIIIFYFILTPLSILSRLFNSSNDFRLKNNSKTNFNSTNKVFDKKSFRRAW